MALMEAAHEAKFVFEIAGDRTLFKVVSFDGAEKMSVPYHFSMELAMEGSESDDYQFEEHIGQEACLIISGQTDDRYVHGIISEIECMGERGSFTIFKFALVPSIWLLSLRVNSRIFQNKKVNEIIKKVLTDAGIPSDRFRFALTNSYLTREYCVQYNESDLDFISRLMEEEGIFYFFEHKKDSHILVMADKNVAYKPISEDSNEVPYHVSEALVPEEESVFNFRFSGRVTKGKVTLNDYNFKKPALNLKSSKTNDKNQNLEHYEYPGEYIEKNEGERRAEVRLKEQTVYQSRGDGRSFCPLFLPGYTFKLKGHPRDTLDEKEYTLVSVVHKGKQPQVLEEFTPFDEHEYYNVFTCIFKDTVFKPPRVTPKPIVPGTQTAIVVGPKGEESYLDDEHYGMIKVQFHWDREGKRDEHSSCWIRVAYPYAGEKHGMQFTPLIGDEVLVGFLEGDPDRPVVVGSLFKGDHKALVRGKDMTHVQFLTPYQHKVSLDDKNTAITVSTGGGETIKMAESKKDGKYIRLTTADGHTMLMNKGSGVSCIEIFTEKFHNVILDDQNDVISINDRRNALQIELDSGSGQIKIINAASGGGWTLLQCLNGKISLKAKNIEVFSSQTTDIRGAGGKVVIDPGGIHINAGGKPVEVIGSIIKLNS